MSSTTTKRASSLGTIGFMVGAVVFAALAGMIMSQLMENRYSQEPVQPVVVVKGDVQAGVPLRAEDLGLVDWPRSAVPRGTFSKVKSVVDAKRVPLLPLVKGQAVLLSQLSQPNAGIGVASLIENGKRAVSIKTDDPATLASLIYPGARVDVLSTVQRSHRKGNRMVTQTVLQNVKVLAVGEDIDPLTIATRRQPKTNEDGTTPFGRDRGDSKEVRRVITVLVTPVEAEDLSRAEREGKIYISLRNPRDDSVRKVTRRSPPAEAPPRDWGMTVTKKEEPKKKKTRRSKRRKSSLKVAASGTPRIRIFRGK